MEHAVVNLESSLKTADSRLGDICWKLDMFDRDIAQAVGTEGEQVSVMNLLDSVIQVKEDYENLKQQIVEVQELEKLIRDSLRYKAMRAQETISKLRMKINKHQHQLHR